MCPKVMDWPGPPRPLQKNSITNPLFYGFPKWGKVDALFWGTAIPVFDTKYIAEIAAKYGLRDDYFSLGKVINWENMSSLSYILVNSMNVRVSKKDLYYLIVETCFVQCGEPMVQVNV